MEVEVEVVAPQALLALLRDGAVRLLPYTALDRTARKSCFVALEGAQPHSHCPNVFFFNQDSGYAFSFADGKMFSRSFFCFVL